MATRIFILRNKALWWKQEPMKGSSSTSPPPAESLNEILTYKVRTIWMKVTEQYFPVVLFIMFRQHWACGFDSN